MALHTIGWLLKKNMNGAQAARINLARYDGAKANLYAKPFFFCAPIYPQCRKANVIHLMQKLSRRQVML
jgi:hypothetical protein